MSHFQELRSDQSMIIVPNTMVSLAVVAGFVRESARLSGMHSEDIPLLELAVEEAAANILEHAYMPGEKEHFSVMCGRRKGGFQVVIKDRGMPFDPRLMPTYDPGTDLSHRSTAGLGTFLIFSAVDEARFINLGPQGKEIHLFKASSMAVDEELISDLAEVPEPPVDEEIKYRLVRPEESVFVSRCMYRAYGYTYAVGDDIYYPERVEAMNKSGEMVSAVAVTSSGQIAGHCALLAHRKGSGVREIGKAAVIPEYRGRSILKDLTQRLIEHASSLGLSGLFVEAVTNHLYSQKSAVRNGFKSCAILLGFLPEGMQFKNMENRTPQRGSVVICWRSVEEDHEQTPLYIPEKDRAYFDLILDSLDIPRKRCSSDAQITFSGSSHISTTLGSASNSAEIDILVWGEDGASRLKSIMKELKIRKTDVVYLRISASQIGADRIAEYAGELGFIPAGLIPDRVGGDVMIYQYLNDIRMELEQLEILSDTAGKMVNYLSGKLI